MAPRYGSLPGAAPPRLVAVGARGAWLCCAWACSARALVARHRGAAERRRRRCGGATRRAGRRGRRAGARARNRRRAAAAQHDGRGRRRRGRRAGPRRPGSAPAGFGGSGAGEDDAAATAADGEEYSVVEIPMSVFLGFASVRKFLASQGLDRDAPDWKLHQYVPRNVVVQLWPARVRGTVGDAALDGHVAFDLAYYNYNTTARARALLGVVPRRDDALRRVARATRRCASRAGEREGGERARGRGLRRAARARLAPTRARARAQVSPTMRAFGGGENGGNHQRLHVCGLKLRDPRAHLARGRQQHARDGAGVPLGLADGRVRGDRGRRDAGKRAATTCSGATPTRTAGTAAARSGRRRSRARGSRS